MFGRIFGRGKDEPEAAVCAKCGRTLLAGEWTRRVVDADGQERLICSLCGPDLPLDQDMPPDAAYSRGNGGRLREPRADVDEASAAAKDEPLSELAAKEAEIASLLERLARAERQNQELRIELDRLRATAPDSEGDHEDGEATAATGPVASGPAPYEQLIDSSEPGELTWGETPAEFAAAVSGLQEGEDQGQPVTEPAAEAYAVVAEDTQPLPAVDDGDEQRKEEEATPPPEQEGASADEADALSEVPEEATSLAGEIAEPELGEEAADVEEAAPPGEAEVAALALLQRGVDLFNVSRVPRKIAETNEQLGSPLVQAETEDDVVAITFMWSMGWYRFQVDTESGDVTLADRGYEEITSASANAGVRADGTVHLAPAQISRAAAQRIQHDDLSAAQRPGERGPDEPESPSVAAQKPPEILSKSLLGQRSDDGPAVWEKTKARDFDWER